MDRRRFIGSNLRLARSFHALTQTELSAMVGCTQSLIAHAESGKEPSRDVLEALAHVLQVLPDFFFESQSEEFRDNECNFRKRKATTQQTRSIFLSHGTLFHSFVRRLETQVDLPSVSIPEIRVDDDSDVDRAAARCRMSWGLGLDRPVSNMTRLAESIGCIATRFYSNRSTVDAFSRYGTTPIVVLNSDKSQPTRIRHEVAHEVGHLVMHRGLVTGVDEEDETERQAERFASVFLCPPSSFARDFPSTTRLDWNTVFAIKQRWGVSAKSVVYRAQMYGLIGADEARRAYKHYSYMGWHKGEPHEPAAEDPEFVDLSIKAICDDGGVTFDEFIASTSKDLRLRPMLLYSVLGKRPTPASPAQQIKGQFVRLDDWRAQRARNDGEQ